MHKKHWIAVALAATVATTACETETMSGPAPETVDDVALAEIDAAAGVIETASTSERGSGSGPGALFDRLAGEIPGFGGFYFDDSCNLVVVLTDLSQTEHATAILTPLLRRFLNSARRRCPRDAAVIAQQGDFTWQELTRYRDVLRPVAQLRGVGRIAISVPANRIIVVVRDESLAQQVKHEAELLGVPPAALEVVVGGGRG